MQSVKDALSSRGLEESCRELHVGEQVEFSGHSPSFNDVLGLLMLKSSENIEDLESQLEAELGTTEGERQPPANQEEAITIVRSTP